MLKVPLDIDLPDLDGIEVLHRFARRPPLADHGNLFPQVSTCISPPTATCFNPVELFLQFSHPRSQHDLVGFLR